MIDEFCVPGWKQSMAEKKIGCRECKQFKPMDQFDFPSTWKGLSICRECYAKLRELDSNEPRQLPVKMDVVAVDPSVLCERIRAAVIVANWELCNSQGLDYSKDYVETVKAAQAFLIEQFSVAPRIEVRRDAELERDLERRPEDG